MATQAQAKEYANLVLQLSNAVLTGLTNPAIDLGAARATLKQRLFPDMSEAGA